MKNDQYFKFEVNLLNDGNVLGMMTELGGALAVGIYTMMLQLLRTQDTYELSYTPLILTAIANRCDVEVGMIEKVIRDYGLFIVDEEAQTFRSPYLDKVMENLEEKRKTNVENGKKGGRPKKHLDSSEKPASKAEKPNQNQKSKVKESKCITTIINNNSSNTTETSVSETAAVAVMIHSGGEEKQRFLQPIKTNVSTHSEESVRLPSFTPRLSIRYPSAIRPSAEGFVPVTRGLQADYPPAATPIPLGLAYITSSS